MTAGGGQQRGWPVGILTLNRVRKLLEGRWAGWAGQLRVPGGGAGGTPTYLPQNDPHDALIFFFNTHNLGKKTSEKICPSAQNAISQGPTRRSDWGSNRFCVFRNSDYFEYSRHMGQKNKIRPLKSQIRERRVPKLCGVEGGGGSAFEQTDGGRSTTDAGWTAPGDRGSADR